MSRLPAVVFRLVDRMPRRQREDPVDARANADFEGIRDAILRHLPDANC